MALSGLPNLLPLLVISTFIAGFACLFSASIFEYRTTKFVLRVGLPVIVAAVIGGTYWLLKARHLDAEYRWMRAFQTERSVPLLGGTTLEADFTAPATDLVTSRASTYLVTLPDLPFVPRSSPREWSPVDCTVQADGREVFVDSTALEMLNFERGGSPKTIIARFSVTGGKTYRVNLKIPPALVREGAEAVRLRFSYYPPALYEASVGVGMIGGIGESLWLAAYGVFVAAIIRVGLNWREAADRRAFLVGQPPP